MQHGGQPVAEAAQATIDDVGSLGGTGGVITIDREGNIALPFNTAGMYRAWHTSTGGSGTAIYRE